MSSLYAVTMDTGSGGKESIDFHQQRHPYAGVSMTTKELQSQTDPVVQFVSWFEEAKALPSVTQPNAMALATCTKEGRPSLRYVLMKHFDKDGIVFYTNYNSRKGSELTENPNVAVVFYWEPLHRQVRVEGSVVRISREESESYFKSRPYDSRLSASVSPQSSVITEKRKLEEDKEKMKALYPESLGGPPTPEHWGGFRIVPHSFEFWIGQSNRLHDRFLFTKEKDSWRVDCLAP